ncbi:hypothetical protein BV25DRAFT_1840945 [Artomyces pyxidatus]|uniref:Uncharacterized protein n=1 Tax=Artomyces pyxidatus TaxID=48021 RepID=A0ACB8SRU5_9AGAM|nr:hypothetical protein BV25DRAFT_1840945 [Artomyces pyxidatus]
MLGRKDESFGTAVHTWAVELARLGAPRLETLSISPSPWIHIIRLTKPYTSTVLGAAYFNRNIVSGDPAFQSPHAVFTTIEFQDQQPKQDLFAAILKKAAHISRHDLITLSVHKDVSSVDNNGCSVYRTKLRALTTGGGAFHLVPALRSLAATIPSVYRALSVVYSCGSSVSFIATAMRAPLHHALRMGSYFRSLAVSVPRGTTGMILTATDPRFAAGSPDLPETLVVTIPFDVVADAAPSVLGWLPLHRTATRLALECEVAPAGRRGRRAWRVLDAFFGGLATVCVRGAAAQCLVERLGAAEVGTVLGGMRSITVARVDFMGAGMGVFARLVAELRGRGRGRRLALVECDVTAEMVRRARGVLGEHAVHWDGKQRGPARLGQDESPTQNQKVLGLYTHQQ